MKRLCMQMCSQAFFFTRVPAFLQNLTFLGYSDKKWTFALKKCSICDIIDVY